MGTKKWIDLGNYVGFPCDPPESKTPFGHAHHIIHPYLRYVGLCYDPNDKTTYDHWKRCEWLSLGILFATAGLWFYVIQRV